MVFRAFSRMWKMCSEFSSKNIKCLSSDEASFTQSLLEKSDEKSELLYEKAIGTLNAIQTLYGPNVREKKEEIAKQHHVPLTQAVKFAEIQDLPVEHLDKLAAIHVAGTKGKGSVCAFCESILRRSGYKTGFYSSPHLFEVRERMRINGQPISKELFTHHFWKCWESFVIEQKCYYKTFLVFMAFHVFLEEEVDVAIIEVGCGGEYDVTNVLRHPVVCGVTLLDKDHLKSLGGTVESIAWHKAGIFKPGVPAFTVPQDPASMKVLAERARERKVSLKIVPELAAQDGKLPVLGIQGKHQHQNASLAIHLCRTWIERRNDDGKVVLNEPHEEPHLNEFPPYAEVISPTKSFTEGLANAFWPGRTQCVEIDNFTFYIDGAHTRKSIEACSDWFCEKSNEEKLTKRHKTMVKILIFNFKGCRDARSLLEPLVKCNFDYVVFCPNLLKDQPQLTTSDISNFYQDVEMDKMKCYKNQEIWREVLHNYKHSNISPTVHTTEGNSRVFTCVFNAFHWVVGEQDVSINDREYDTCLRDVITCTRGDHVQVFVTGSLYLVGMVLRLLQPRTVHM